MTGRDHSRSMDKLLLVLDTGHTVLVECFRCCQILYNIRDVQMLLLITCYSTSDVSSCCNTSDVVVHLILPDVVVHHLFIYVIVHQMRPDMLYIIYLYAYHIVL